MSDLVLIKACAHRTPGLAQTLCAAMPQELLTNVIETLPERVAAAPGDERAQDVSSTGSAVAFVDRVLAAHSGKESP